jgi:hypothetical protein
MPRTKLNPVLLEPLQKMTRLSSKSIVEKISRMVTETGLTHNAAAHVIATENKKSFRRYLDQDDISSWRNYQLLNRPSPPVITRTVRAKTDSDTNPFVAFKDYKPLDYFATQYILEISRAYKAKCYTSVFILTRKVVENLIIKIIEAKFPGRDDLIYNAKRTRTLDFSKILENLEREKGVFSINGQNVIDRLIPLVDPFKEEANAKAHRWYHIVNSPTEINNWQLPTIMELIRILEIEVSLRTS